MKTIIITLDSDLLCRFLNEECTLHIDNDIQFLNITSQKDKMTLFSVEVEGSEKNLVTFLLELGYFNYQIEELGLTLQE
jgi:hypothetical protein